MKVCPKACTDNISKLLLCTECVERWFFQKGFKNVGDSVVIAINVKVIVPY